MALATQLRSDGWTPNMPNTLNTADSRGYLPYDAARGSHAFQMHHLQPPHHDVSPNFNTHFPHAIPNDPQSQTLYNLQDLSYRSPWSAWPASPMFHDENQGHQPFQFGQGRVAYQSDPESIHKLRSASNPTRSESLASNSRSSVSSHPTASAKTITYNETIDPGDRVNFETEVDELMKAIQGKKDQADVEASKSPVPAHTPRADLTEPLTPGSTAAPAENKLKKKWVCDGPSCNKAFVQKTHLEIHRRTHTGVKPYICTEGNCGLAFSQRGNLKTHIRRHTGEKPFPCRVCGKTFAQRGNVRSHEETHEGVKPFVCKLDKCNKPFSQLGNMKTHQNNFHKKTIKRLIPMFAGFAAKGHVPEEYQKLFEYFIKHYKNSNKGVKGRGKARIVAGHTRKKLHQSRTSSGPTSQQPLPQTPRYHDSGHPSLADQTVTASGITTAATGRPFSPSHQSYTWQDVVKDESVDQLFINYLPNDNSTFMNRTVFVRGSIGADTR